MHHLEHLENRQLFAADPSFVLTSKGTLIVQGGSGDDQISATLAGGHTKVGLLYVMISSNLGGKNEYFTVFHETKISYPKIKRIVFDGGDGNDTININCSEITKPVSLLGGNGDDKLTFSTDGVVYADGGAGNDIVGNRAPGLDPTARTKNRDVLNDFFSFKWSDPANTILGSDGDDTLQGSKNDIVDGGNGNDTASDSVYPGVDHTISSQRADALVHDYYARIGATGIEISEGLLY